MLHIRKNYLAFERYMNFGRRYVNFMLVVDEDDINEALEHKQELTMDDLKNLEAMKVNIVQEQFFSGKEDRDMTIKTTEIKEMLF